MAHVYYPTFVRNNAATSALGRPGQPSRGRTDNIHVFPSVSREEPPRPSKPQGLLPDYSRKDPRLQD